MASERHSVAVTCPLLGDDFLLDCAARSPAPGPLYASPLTIQPPSCMFGEQNRLKLKSISLPKWKFLTNNLGHSLTNVMDMISKILRQND